MPNKAIVNKQLRQFPNLEFIGYEENDNLVVLGVTDERTNKAYLTGFGVDEDFREFKSGYYLLVNEMAFMTVGFGTIETINTLENTHETDRVRDLNERDMRNMLNHLFYDTVH